MNQMAERIARLDRAVRAIPADPGGGSTAV
jgi:hypothetical protein